MPFASGIGLPEVLLFLVIVLVIFGPKRLPGLGKSLGSSLREFKESVSGKDEEDSPGERIAALSKSADDESPLHVSHVEPVVAGATPVANVEGERVPERH